MLTFCYRLRKHGKSFDIAPTWLLRSMGSNFRYRSDFQSDRLYRVTHSRQEAIETRVINTVQHQKFDKWLTTVNKTLLEKKKRPGKPAGGGQDGLEMILFYVASTCVMTKTI